MQISITDSFARTILKRMFTYFDTASMYQGNSGSTSNLQSENTFWMAPTNSSPVNQYNFFALCQGAVPTDFTGMGEYQSGNTRWNDRLVVWTYNNFDNSLWTEDSGSAAIYLSSATRSNASQSGTATWFWWAHTPVSSSTITHQAVFTVGTLGSGADFEMRDVDIVSGRGYKLINGPRLSLATEYNY